MFAMSGVAFARRFVCVLLFEAINDPRTRIVSHPRESIVKVSYVVGQELGVTEERLRGAVDSVSDSPDAARKFLERSPTPFVRR